MPPILMIALASHVLAGLFWLGSSFWVAMNKGAGAKAMFRWQMLAALIVFVAGGYLWHALHEGVLGWSELLLIAGALCAVGAAGAQGMLVAGTLRKMARGAVDQAKGLHRVRLGGRYATVLLAVGFFLMVASKSVYGGPF